MSYEPLPSAPAGRAFAALRLAAQALAVVLGLAGCDAPGATCRSGGMTYRQGEAFPSEDGCNSCSCGPGGEVYCTARGCLSTCSYEGRSYHPGDSFPSVDGCNTCSCSEAGRVACTEKACGATCSYDGRSYLEGQSFPASDGCNTCSCGANGQVACTKRACFASTWLSLMPKQCNGNPWQQVSSKGDGDAPSYPDAELLSIDNFFEDQKIELLELGLLRPDDLFGTCASCECARGDRLVVRASAAQAADLVNKFGFTAIPAEAALSYAPRACYNPWPPAQKPGDEAKSVQGWAMTQGATVGHTGFVYKTAAVSSCNACNCDRGDRLVTYPKAAADTAKLKALGFSALQ